MTLSSGEVGGVAFLVVAFGVLPIAWKLRMSIYQLLFLAGGAFFLSEAVLIVSACEGECDLATWPGFRFLYMAFGYWGPVVLLFLVAVLSLSVFFKYQKKDDEPKNT